MCTACAVLGEGAGRRGDVKARLGRGWEGVWGRAGCGLPPGAGGVASTAGQVHAALSGVQRSAEWSGREPGRWAHAWSPVEGSRVGGGDRLQTTVNRGGWVSGRVRMGLFFCELLGWTFLCGRA